MRSNSSSVTSSIGWLRCVVPALLTTISRSPKAASVVATRRATSLSLETSPAQNCALPPAPTISRVTRSPFATSMSLTTTFAPSAAKRLAMPSPNPDPAPVTMAILPARRIPPLSMLQHDGLEHGKSAQRLKSLFAPVPGMLHPAERQPAPAACAIAVHENLSAANRARHPQLPRPVARPDAGDKPERRAVRDADGVGFVPERHRSKPGPEHFVARERAVRRHVANKARLDVIAGGGRVWHDRPGGDGRIPFELRFVQEPVHALFLTGSAQRARIEIGKRRADLQSCEARGEHREDFFVARALDDEAASRRAGLPCVLDDRIDDNRQRRIEVGIGEHDLCALAPELERHRAMALRGLCGDPS